MMFTLNSMVLRYLYSAVVIALLCACGDTSKPSWREHSGEIFGSTFYIKYKSERNLNTKIDSIFNDFNNVASTYKSDSEISRFNRSKVGIEQSSTLFANLVKFSKDWNKRSDGYFNPAVGPLVDLWGFGAVKAKVVPNQKQIDSALVATDIHQTLIAEGVNKSNPAMALNFNSITGYCNDIVALYMDNLKVTDYLIEIGGEVRVKGKSDKDKLWVLAIDKPVEGMQQIYRKVKLDSTSMATSGNYRKFFIDPVTNQKITHTINPKNGNYQVSKLISATIVHPDCAVADALATGVMAMGDSLAPLFLNQEGYAAMLVFTTAEKGLDVKYYNGFENFILP